MQRLLMTWHADWPSDATRADALEAELERIAGVPVQLEAAVAPRVRVLRLACTHPGSAPCAEALRRLGADPRVVDLVPDRRRRAFSGGADATPSTIR